MSHLMQELVEIMMDRQPVGRERMAHTVLNPLHLYTLATRSATVAQYLVFPRNDFSLH
jgi:hypothetical protein